MRVSIASTRIGHILGVLLCGLCLKVGGAVGASGASEKTLAEAADLRARAEKLSDENHPADAVPLVERALQLEQGVLGPRHRRLSETLGELAGLYRDIGKYAEAEQLYERALDLCNGAEGAERSIEAILRNNLGLLYEKLGAYTKAEALFRRSLAIRAQYEGRDAIGTAFVENNLANVLRVRGVYHEALTLQEHALGACEKKLGPQHFQTLVFMNNLALIHQGMGNYREAEPLLRRVLALRTELLGEKHPDTNISLNNLASLYWETAEYAKAQSLLERAIAAGEAQLGPRHPEVLTLQANLAEFYRAQGQYAKAKTLLEHVLELQRAMLGPEHPAVALSLNNLGEIYRSMGEFQRAEPLCRKAIELGEKLSGPESPFVAESLANLGALYYRLRDLDRAEAALKRAVQLKERLLGETHPGLAYSQHFLALVHMLQGRREEAIPLFERSFELSERGLRQLYTESRATSYLEQLHLHEDAIYSLASEHPEDPRLRRLALRVALLRKGRTLEVGIETGRAIQRSLTLPEDQVRFQRLQGLRSRLATLLLSGAGQKQESGPALRKLEDEASELEAELAQRSALLREQRSLPSRDLIGALARQLPRDGVLVEAVSFRAVDLRPNVEGRPSGGHRYLIMALRSDERIEMVALNSAELVDVTVHAMLQRFSRPDRVAVAEPAARKLYDLVMAPLVGRLPEARSWYLSLDGELQLVPFAALHDGHRFLIEKYRFNYLTSGRDLLHPGRGRRDGVMVALADPELQGWPEGAPLKTAATRGIAQPVQRAMADELRFLGPLPGSRKEALAIAHYFPQSRVLLGKQATEEALLTVTAPRALHVATHGIVLGDGVEYPSKEQPPARGRVSLGESEGHAIVRDPMVRSALVLAGAGQLAVHPIEISGGEQRDGLVTALEVLGMNLWGTQLVVLSACETGRGETPWAGQGIYGFRRAFFIAGAETLVTSLWKVQDNSTRELMEHFYRRLAQGVGRLEAMQQAAFTVKKRHPHPYYWAPFIVIGRGEPL